VWQCRLGDAAGFDWRIYCTYNKYDTMKRKTKLFRPTTTEDATINRGIAGDREEILKHRGRPKSATHKISVTVRLDPKVVAFFRASGRGWQTRMNEALVAYVGKMRRTD
jgi:uncharacterized protein (DUF4415 family)